MKRTALPILLLVIFSMPMVFGSTATFGNRGIPEYSSEFRSSFPAMQWGYDTEGYLCGAVVKHGGIGNPSSLLVIRISREGDFHFYEAAQIPEQAQFVGSRMIAVSDGLIALVHLRLSGRTGIYVLPIDGGGPRDLPALPAVPLRQPHEFRDWGAAADQNGDILITLNELGGAFKNSSAIQLARIHDPHSRIPVTSVTEIYRTDGYVADPRVLMHRKQALILWKEGAQTDRTELILAVLADDGDAAVLHRAPAGMAFTSSVGFTATHTPPILYPRLRDPGLIAVTAPSGNIYVIFQYVLQTQTVITLPQTHMEVRTFTFESERIEQTGTLQVTDTQVRDFVYPGTAVIFRENELLLPYIREFYRGSDAVSDPMVAAIALDEKGVPRSAEIMPALRSPRFAASVGLVGEGTELRYVWMQKTLNNMYQMGTVKPDTHPSASKLPVVRYGDSKETVVSLVLGFPSALIWAAAAATLGGAPGLLVFWCFLIVLQRRRPDLLHTHSAATAGLGMAGIIALMQAVPFMSAAPAGPAGILWTVLFPFLFYVWAKRKFIPGIGYARYLYAAWAGAVLYTAFASWPRVFSALEAYMHLQ